MAITTTSDEPYPVTFLRPKFDVSKPRKAEDGYLQSLPDLVEFNATYNRDHLFCAQYGPALSASPCFVTHGELHDAVLRASAWFALQGLAERPRTVDGKIIKSRPVAMLMTSDVTWFIAFVALLRLGVPVLCMSARLSPQAVAHLMQRTSAKAVLVSPQLDALASESQTLLCDGNYEGSSPAFHHVPPYTEFLNPTSKLDPASVPPPPRQSDHTDRNVVILHSSGTTGLPKPIFHSHAYLLGYCACHELAPEQVGDALNVSTLPLFHGFGLLAPSLSLSTGLPFALSASTTIPTGPSTYEILRSSGATSLLTVPSILEELFQLPDARGIEALRRLQFVAVGGAPMKQTVAKALASAGVPLLNHWGVTEIGAIAPIVVPGPDTDWRYLRLRRDLHLRVEPVNDSSEGFVRLVGRPPLADEDFPVADLLTRNSENPREFAIAGRADDLVVLATGEKVRPHALEARAAEHPAVRAALAIGAGRFQLALLLEAAPHVPLDVADEAAVRVYVDEVWPAIAEGNAQTDGHARVAREMVLVTHPGVKPLLRTPKGSVPRSSNAEHFKDELDALYARADFAGAEQLPLGDPEALLEVVRTAVHAAYTIPRDIGDSDDFFERGMDSLQATMLRRRLNAVVLRSMQTDSQAPQPLPLDVVYAHSSVDRLCKAIHEHCGQGSVVTDRIAHMESVAADYVRKVSELRPTRELAPLVNLTEGAIVLLTGSTGSLGSALLYELASSPTVARVYALNRKGSRSLRDRQEVGLQKIGATVEDRLWEKVVLLEGELGEPHFGLPEEAYGELRQASHIIHNAWPMDFNRTLDSFRPHLDAAMHIVQLALDSSAAEPVRLLFASSIAVVGRHPLAASSTPIPEVPVVDPRAVDAFGYAEAKWVCERMFAQAGAAFAGRVSATSVRIGQMTGAEASGVWNVAEHIPMLVKSCVAVRRLPDIPGSASWIPVNRAARALSEVLFSAASPHVVHLENPIRQPWSATLEAVGAALGLPQDRLPYAEWLERVKAHPDPEANPCSKILPFLEHEFLRMATGKVVLDTTEARAISPTLNATAAMSGEQVEAYVKRWKQDNFL